MPKTKIKAWAVVLRKNPDCDWKGKMDIWRRKKSAKKELKDWGLENYLKVVPIEITLLNNKRR